jgi:hypothetical protein
MTNNIKREEGPTKEFFTKSGEKILPREIANNIIKGVGHQGI